MTKDQLHHIRKSRSQTREEMAITLGCSASAIVQWEGGTRAIPDWVEDKLLRQVPITLPLEELHALLDLARAEQVSFDTLLTESLREYLRARRSNAPLTTLKAADAPGEKLTTTPVPVNYRETLAKPKKAK